MGTDRDPTYYLSSYISPPDERSVLAPRHDHNIALWRVGESSVELVRFWELERISGQKHHYWPLFSLDSYNALIEHLLATEGLTPADVTASWGTPGVPRFREIVLPPGAGEYAVHSLAHLYSGLLLDGKIFAEDVIVGMALDGRPDFGLDSGSKKHWFAGCVARRGVVDFFPVESPGPLYDAATSVFESEPGTLMALASACPTEVQFDTVGALADLELYGGRRIPLDDALPLVAEMVRSAETQLAGRALDDRFTKREHVTSATMKLVQEACEIVVSRNVDRLIELTGVDPREAHLSMSGGFALNCPTNSYLLERYGFKGLLTPPSASDCGQALGLGLLGLYGEGVIPRRRFALGSAYRGAGLDDVDGALAEFAGFVEDVQEFSDEVFVDDIIAGPVVWADGQAEIGPRALGHRSILADPRIASSKDELNQWKDRQWWRPVAPIVLEDRVGEWFDRPGPSPYMLQVAFVHEARRKEVPAIVHLDGSARHQTLTSALDPLLYRAIDAFSARTGVPMLCNTSLNEKGEPIVDTASQALSFAVRVGARVVYLSGRRVKLRFADRDRIDALPARHRRRGDLFDGQEQERDRIWAAWLAKGYDEAALVLMTRSPELRDRELASPTTVSQLAGLAAARDTSGTFYTAVAKYGRMFGPGSGFDPMSDEGSTF